MRSSHPYLLCAALTIALTAAGTSSIGNATTAAHTTNTAVANIAPQTNKASSKAAKNYSKKELKATSGCTTLKPLVLLLHNYAGNGAAIVADSGWRDEARRRGWLLTAPTARESAGRVWDINPNSVDVKNLANHVETYRCHDPKRVYVAGASMGAHMASVMFCTTNLFAAAAPVAGVTITPNCPKRTAPLVAYHGYRDWIVGINGTIPPGLHAAIPPWARTNRYLAVSEYARRAGCITQARTPKVTHAFGQTINDYGCNKTLIVNPQGEHEWPTYATAHMSGVFAKARL